MKILAVTSGKGGVGKTSLSANIGIALSQSGAKTILFDADLQLANVDVALGIQPEFTLQHVVAEEMGLADVICEGPGGLKVIAGGSAISTLMAAGPKRMGTFLSQLDDLKSEADFLLFDTSAGLDNRVMTFCKVAEEIVLVTTPDPASVTDAYATVKVALKRSPGKPIGVVVNMAASDGEALGVFRALSEITRRFLDAELTNLGCVSMDTSVASCNRRRIPFLIGAPDCPASRQVHQIAKRLRSRDASQRMSA
ncbi:MAG: MinD/ParA family protein [Fimbriimonadales bacterium]